jgi:hypothetical protein
MEYINGMCLSSVTDPDSIKFCIAELVIAIEEMHNFGVVHGNICIENVLLDSAGHIKVINFGSATLVEDKSNPINFAHDWHLLGILLANMLNVDILPDTHNYLPHKNTPTLKFILGLVTSDPKERMQFVNGVKWESYFANINWHQLRRRGVPLLHVTHQQRQHRAISQIYQYTEGMKKPAEAIWCVIGGLLPFSADCFDLLSALVKISAYFPNDLKCGHVLERLNTVCVFFANHEQHELTHVALENLLLVFWNVCLIGDTATDDLVVTWILKHGHVIVKLVGNLLCNSNTINHVNLSASLFGSFVFVATSKKIDCDLGITPRSFVHMVRTKNYNGAKFWAVCCNFIVIVP